MQAYLKKTNQASTSALLVGIPCVFFVLMTLLLRILTHLSIKGKRLSIKGKRLSLKGKRLSLKGKRLSLKGKRLSIGGKLRYARSFLSFCFFLTTIVCLSVRLQSNLTTSQGSTDSPPSKGKSRAANHPPTKRIRFILPSDSEEDRDPSPDIQDRMSKRRKIGVSH
jgi:hypothetical protein